MLCWLIKTIWKKFALYYYLIYTNNELKAEVPIKSLFFPDHKCCYLIQKMAISQTRYFNWTLGEMRNVDYEPIDYQYRYSEC